MIFLVRHGSTAMNQGEEKIRSYSDVPLSYEGKEGVQKTAEFIVHMDDKITKFLSSPLQRAMETAAIIAEPIGVGVTPNRGLLPWNLGKLTGAPIKIAAAKMNYLQSYYDIKAPEGESYHDFYSRWMDAVDAMKLYATQHPEENILGVVHSRNLLALPSIIGDRNIGNVPIKGGPLPASVTKVWDDEGTWKFETIFEEKIENDRPTDPNAGYK